LQDYNSKSNIFDTLDSYNQLKRKKDPFDIWVEMQFSGNLCSVCVKPITIIIC
jgi:hypothetical protein